jgi:putative hydrolase of the HAD superfamily
MGANRPSGAAEGRLEIVKLIACSHDESHTVTLETIFLDAGGVLVFPNWRRVSATLAEHGIAADPLALAAADHVAKHEMDVDSYVKSSTDDGRWSRYFDLVLKHARVEINETTDKAIAQLRAYHDVHNLWEDVPTHVLPALDRMRSLGLRLVVVSNVNGTLALLFDRLGLTKRVDLLVDSHREGLEKPDPRLFQRALERAGAQAHSTVHVGDIFHVDVVGARAAGIRAVLLDAANLYEAQECERVGSLAEFVDRLETSSRPPT